jgi:hypothetical protein
MPEFTANESAYAMGQQHGSQAAHMRREVPVVEAGCPECDVTVRFADPPQIGWHVQCESCRSMLVVIELSPVVLDWAFVDPFEPFDDVIAKNRKKPSMRSYSRAT